MKKEFPILEFDQQKEALINPKQYLKTLSEIKRLPERLIITFFKDAIDQLLTEGKIVPHYLLTGENTLQVYRFVDHDVCLIHGVITSAGCGNFYDELIGLGIRKTMFCGGGGALRPELTVGKLVVVESAIRDEGFSYHYAPPARTIDAPGQERAIIVDFLQQKAIDHTLGRVWTTDAFYRETPDKIKMRMAEGACLVEMEQAGLIAVSHFRDVQYGAIIYAGDDVSAPTWDSRKWHHQTDLRRSLIELCLDIVLLF